MYMYACGLGAAGCLVGVFEKVILLPVTGVQASFVFV